MYFPSPTEIITRSIIQNKHDEDKKAHVESDLIEGRTCTTVADSIPMDSDIMLGSKSKTRKLKIPEFFNGEKLKSGVRQFLSNYGLTAQLVRFKKGVGLVEHVDFDILQGKYLLICCFQVPMHSIAATDCRALIDAYDHLSRIGFPFELIVVANMRRDVVYNRQSAFYHFYSAFSCLAIPFSDFQTRDSIFSRMSSCFSNSKPAMAILVDPNEIVLHKYRALHLFFYYSPECIPFLDTTLDAIHTEDDQLRSRLDPMYSTRELLSRLDPMYSFTEDAVNQQRLSLYGDILQCDPNRILCRFNPETETDESVPVSTVVDLSRKYVGLYLCIDGSIMKQIKEAHDNCVAKNQQLEIVLVCMALYDEPHSYYKRICEALQSFNIRSWFIFAYDSKVCRRLWRIFGLGLYYPGEKLIIIPPNCESGELCGREVITNFGINEYPFTRTAILRRRLEYVRSLTPLFPSSLFNNKCLIQNGRKFKSKQLQGTNVLLYLSWCKRDLDMLLMKNYPDIKAKGWEVVFVPLEYTHRYWNERKVDRLVWEDYPYLDLEEMPWPFMLPSAAAKASIKEKLFFPEDDKTSYLFTVGKDGNIVSRDTQRILETEGITESLFADVLERDLAYTLADMPLFDN